MYNDSNSLGDRAKEGRGSERRHAGTGEGIRARIHVANSHGNRAEEGHRSDRRHSANSLRERVDSCMSVGTSIVVAYVGVGGMLRSSDVSKWAKLDMFEKHERTASVSVTPLIALLVATPMGFMPLVKRGNFVLQRATKPAKV